MSSFAHARTVRGTSLRFIQTTAVRIGGAALVALAATAGQAAAMDLCNNTNPQGVMNNPPSHRTACHLSGPAHITEIVTYHWNNGRGAVPGTIMLYSPNSPMGGGWTYARAQAMGSTGQGGAPNVNWTASVNINVPAGDYQVIDSDFPTWSWNPASQNEGFAIVRGYYVSAAQPNTMPPPNPYAQPTPPRPYIQPNPSPQPMPAAAFTPCHANSASYVELAKPVCFGPPGTTMMLYVSRAGLRLAPNVVYLKSGQGNEPIAASLNGAINLPGLASSFSAPLTPAGGNGLAPYSSYTFQIPAGACFTGRGRTWYFDLWVPGSGDVDEVGVRC